MSKITEHFDDSEFACKCGCGIIKTNKKFVERLEKLHKAMNAKSIVITSGYRCPKHSVSVGGYSNDAHVRGFAVDIMVYKQDGSLYSASTIAHECEKLKFGGIGIISSTACHVDARDENPFDNSHWWGDERTGNNNIQTFADYKDIMPIQSEVSTGKRFAVYVDDKKVAEVDTPYCIIVKEE